MDSADKIDEAPHTEPLVSEFDKQMPNEGKASSQTVDSPLQPASDLADELQNYDWDQLLEKYAVAMEEHARADEQVRNQTAELQEVSKCRSNRQRHMFLMVFLGLCELVSIDCSS